MIVEGGEYIGENAVWSDEGAIYNGDRPWRSVAPPTRLDEHGGRGDDVLASGTFISGSLRYLLADPRPTVDDAPAQRQDADVEGDRGDGQGLIPTTKG